MTTTLQSNEQIIYQSKVHWIYLAPAAFLVMIGLCCTALSIITALAEPPPNQPPPPTQMIDTLVMCSGCILVLALILTVTMALNFVSSDLILTNRRVIFETGIMRRRTREFFLNQIDSVTIETPLLGRFLNYGSIVVSGSGGLRQPFYRISNPQEIRNHIQQQIANQR
ncbi:MAG: hypothetical protein Kow0031_23950 [Anaerolineae bacterium]